MHAPIRIPGPPGTARRYSHGLPPLLATHVAIPSPSLRDHLPDLRYQSPPTDTPIGSTKSWRADAGSEYSIGKYETWKAERAERQAKQAPQSKAERQAKRAKKTARNAEHRPFYTITEELWMTQHEQLLEKDAVEAEAYALSALWSSAKRILDARTARANAANDREMRQPCPQARPPPSQPAKEKKRAAREARLARQMGRPALSEWAGLYVDTHGSVYGFPRLLVESLGEGEGVLEFGGGRKGEGKGEEGGVGGG